MLDATDLIPDACAKHAVRWDTLIAEAAIWENPDVHHHQISKTADKATDPDLEILGVTRRPGLTKIRVHLGGGRLD